MVVTGLVIGTAGMFLLTRIDGGSTYIDFLAPLLMLGLALGVSIAPATDTIMGSFPESELGVAGGANDTALELGGALGIAVLGSVLGTAYRDELTELAADRLPAEAMAIAKDSVGGGLAVAEQIGQISAAGPDSGRAIVEAVQQSFAHAVSHTSLIGGIVMAAGTLLVLVALPGRRAFATKSAETGTQTAATEVADTQERGVSSGDLRPL